MVEVTKVEIFIIPLNNEVFDVEQLQEALGEGLDDWSCRIGKIVSTDVGEWYDDHPLNKKGSDELLQSLFYSQGPCVRCKSTAVISIGAQSYCMGCFSAGMENNKKMFDVLHEQIEKEFTGRKNV